MRAPGSAPWTCTQCGRTVPAREPRCHCGLLRAESSAAGGADETPSHGGSFGRTVLGLALVAAAGYGFYAASLQREQRQQAAELARQERIRLETVPSGGPTAGPPETAPRTFAPSPYTPPVGGTLSFPSPKAEATPAALKARASSDDSSPSPTSMEEAWARANELLDAPLQKITAETAELQEHYAPFAYTCLASPDANWLVAMKSSSFVRAGIPYSKFGVTVDCEFARRELVARGNVLKAELDAAQRLAHENRVLPGHWRKLVETHQLEIWDAY